MPSRTASAAPWSDDRVERLTRLWRDGWTARRIAERLGVSRNAVIGKVHRLGLSADRTHAVAVRRPAAKTLGRRPARPAPRHPGEPKPELEGLVPDIADLTLHACRWPIGDPGACGFAFCGRPAESGPYCSPHAKLAYRRRPSGPCAAS